jgi:hypothetical protein
MHRLNSNRVWSSQLKQTIAGFDEKLATILIKQTPRAVKRRPSRRRRDGEAAHERQSRVGRAAIAELEQQVKIGRGEFRIRRVGELLHRSGNPGPHSTP